MSLPASPMPLPSCADIFAVTDTTWPAAAHSHVGPFTLRDGQGGGSRVSAATVAPDTDADAITAHLDQAEAAMTEMGQPCLFQVREPDREGATLDGILAARGYEVLDPVVAHVVTTAALASEPLQMLRTFRIWPPIAAQREIWAEGGIGLARLAVMERVAVDRITLLGRAKDTPAATAFVACHRDVAMLHALEVAPAFRREGLGAAMMRAAGHWAQERGAHHLAVLVTRANLGANTLYRRLGMQEVTGYHYRIRRET